MRGGWIDDLFEGYNKRRDIYTHIYIYMRFICCVDMSRSIRNLKGKNGIFVIL